MKKHVISRLPEEACGMLGGTGADTKIVLPITNQAQSPVRYYMDSLEMLQGFDYLDKNGLELIATFHSHPAGPDHPSETDIREFAYPGTAVLIWSPGSNGDWQVRAYLIENDFYREIDILTVA